MAVWCTISIFIQYAKQIPSISLSYPGTHSLHGKLSGFSDVLKDRHAQHMLTALHASTCPACAYQDSGGITNPCSTSRSKIPGNISREKNASHARSQLHADRKKEFVTRSRTTNSQRPGTANLPQFTYHHKRLAIRIRFFRTIRIERRSMHLWHWFVFITSVQPQTNE